MGCARDTCGVVTLPVIAMNRRMADLRTNFFHYELVKRAITMAMDKKDREREQVSVLLSGLYGSVLTMNQIGKGFERLFEVVDDLALDIPDARRRLTL